MNHMAIDQHGTAYHNLGPRPRQALLRRLGRKGAAKMYRDRPLRAPVHVGYVIAGLWLTLYRVEPFEKEI